jgi:hypothetical protein
VLPRFANGSWRRSDLALLLVPPIGGILLALASRRDELYRFLVREDSVLEWAQVVAYCLAVAVGIVGGPRLWRSGDRIAAVLALFLAVAALVSAGEELAWGQRVFGFGTPELFAENRQGEVTVHNDSRLDGLFRVALLVAGLYGVVASLVLHGRTPLAPPRPLIGCFGIVALYFSYRLVSLQHPTYVEAKYSEWPELCLAFAVAYWCVAVVTRADRDRGGRVEPRSALRHGAASPSTPSSSRVV